MRISRRERVEYRNCSPAAHQLIPQRRNHYRRDAGASCGQYIGRRHAIWLGSFLSFYCSWDPSQDYKPTGCTWAHAHRHVYIGFFITFANVYICRDQPSALARGLGGFFGVWVSTGSILGAVANYYSNSYKSKLCYQIPLASLFAIPTTLSLSLLLSFLNRPGGYSSKTVLTRLKRHYRGFGEILSSTILSYSRKSFKRCYRESSRRGSYRPTPPFGICSAGQTFVARSFVSLLSRRIPPPESRLSSHME